MPLSNPVLFRGDKMDWATPWSLFDPLNDEFDFVLDAAAAPGNTKCKRYITVAEDALESDWCALSDGGSVWLNPPYGRNIGAWIERAYRESLAGCCVVVLVFARTDTRWWHEWAMKAAEIRLISGRVTFQGAENAAPAPSCLLVFDEKRRLPHFTRYQKGSLVLK